MQGSGAGSKTRQRRGAARRWPGRRLRGPARRPQVRAPSPRRWRRVLPGRTAEERGASGLWPQSREARRWPGVASWPPGPRLHEVSATQWIFDLTRLSKFEASLHWIPVSLTPPFPSLPFPPPPAITYTDCTCKHPHPSHPTLLRSVPEESSVPPFETPQSTGGRRHSRQKTAGAARRSSAAPPATAGVQRVAPRNPAMADPRSRI